MAENIRATVFYDGDCPICTRCARRYERLLRTRGIELQPLQTPGVTERLGLSLEELLTAMRLALPDGRVFAGADAFLEISRRYWWGWPFYLFGQVPGAKPFLRMVYRWVARNRYCISGACRIKNPRSHHGPTSFFDMP